LLVGLLSASLATAQNMRSYIVLARGATLDAKLEADIAKAGGVITRRLPQIGMLVVSAPDGAALSRVSGAKYVMSNLTVQWVDPTRVVEADFANPPFSGDDDFFFDLQWGHTAVKATDAWNAGFRGQGVRVAVLDGGFDLDHPDLAPNINYALSMDFTGEGLQYTLADTFSHGSHTAGTIGAADNAFGTIGVAPEAELVLVKVLGDAGSGSFADVISGIVHAADVNADIINMSLGATLTQNGGCDDTGCWTAREAAELKVAMQRAVTYAHQSGTLVIASAGNDGRDGDKDKATLHLPSDLAHVVSISATAPQGWALDPANAFLDFPASYTNYGRSVIDFAAPGGDFVLPGEDVCFVGGIAQLCWVLDLVFSTGNGGWYWSAGTSMAAPHAAGVAALILSEKGSLNPAQLEAFLRGYSADLGQPGNDPYYGAGRVQWAGVLAAP
jgi:subtilisin family serine protease